MEPLEVKKTARLTPEERAERDANQDALTREAKRKRREAEKEAAAAERAKASAQAEAHDDKERDTMRRVGLGLYARAELPAFQLPDRSVGEFSLTKEGHQWWLARPRPGGDPITDWETLVAPFEIVRGYELVDRGGEMGVTVAFLGPKLQRIEVDIDAADIATPFAQAAVAKLRTMGMRMTGEGRRWLGDYLLMTQPAGWLVYDRAGWRGRSFITPTGECLLSGGGRLSDRARLTCPAEGGSIEAWKEAATYIFTTEAFHWQAAILIGFVGVLVDWLKVLSPIYAFEGTTSKGKSTAQQIPAAAWASPAQNDGLFVSLRGTVNSLESVMARGSGTGVHLDEAKHLKGADDEEAITYGGASGNSRRRLDSKGNVRATLKWFTAMTISAETGYAQRANAEGKAVAGGHAVRCTAINVDDAPEFTPSEFARGPRALIDNFGWAGPKFVFGFDAQDYIREPDRLKAEVERAVEWIVCPPEPKLATIGGQPVKAKAAVVVDPIKRRAALPLSYLKVAADIAIRAGMFDVQPGVISGLIRRLWAGFIDGEMAPRDPVEVAVERLVGRVGARAGYDIVRLDDPRYREAFGFLVDEEVAKDAPGAVCVQRPRLPDLYRREVYLIPAERLAELTGGSASDYKVKQALAAKGIAIQDARGRNTHKGWAGAPKMQYLALLACEITTPEASGEDDEEASAKPEKTAA